MEVVVGGRMIKRRRKKRRSIVNVTMIVIVIATALMIIGVMMVGKVANERSTARKGAKRKDTIPTAVKKRTGRNNPSIKRKRIRKGRGGTMTMNPVETVIG